MGRSTHLSGGHLRAAVSARRGGRDGIVSGPSPTDASARPQPMKSRWRATRPRRIEYTQKIAGELGVQVEPLEVANSVYDPIRKRWVAGTFDLPRNPFTGRAILLVPKRFLRELPTLNPDDWFDYSETALRDDMNLTVMENVNSKEIVRLARRRSQLIRAWTKDREGQPGRPYDGPEFTGTVHDAS